MATIAECKRRIAGHRNRAAAHLRDRGFEVLIHRDLRKLEVVVDTLDGEPRHTARTFVDLLDGHGLTAEHESTYRSWGNRANHRFRIYGRA